MPILVFAFLFGLSMDYEVFVLAREVFVLAREVFVLAREVFVLARIREEYDRIGSTGDAVVGALARTGRLVTCAA